LNLGVYTSNIRVAKEMKQREW